MRAKARLGSQEPTFEVVGDYASSMGDEVADVFEGWGDRFYPCQRRELELMLARDGSGDFAAMTISISKPRQNGKSFSARAYAKWMSAGEGRSVLYSAHNGSTTRKMFKAIVNDCVNNPELSRWVREIYRAAGAEGIYFRSPDGGEGGLIEFSTRTNSGARGGTYDVIVVDEAQELTYDQLDALKPTTIAAERDPQMIYIGTPPGPKCHGEVFRDQHHAAHDGESGGAWWLEWAADGVPDMADVAATLEVAYRTNPALGRRIRERTMRDAIDSYRMRPDSFAREYLGWWSPITSGPTHVITPALWERTGIDAIGVAYGARTAFGVKFSPDGLTYALAGCKLSRRGDAAVELVEVGDTTRGTASLAAELLKRAPVASCVVVDGQSNAGALCENLASAPTGYVVRPKAQDVSQAASMLLDGLRDGTLSHTAVGQEMLDESALGSVRRLIGKSGAWGFGSTDDVDSTAIEAATLALWGARTCRRDPKRRQRLL